MGVSKVDITRDSGVETLIDLTEDTITPETVEEGVTFHDATGELKTGKLKSVKFTEQTLTEEQQTQARQNIGAASEENVSHLSEQIADEVANRENAILDLKAQGVQQVPLFANSIEECTDTSKVYVLPDGYIYAYMGEIAEGGTVATFTNQLPISTDIDTDGNVKNDEIYNKGDTDGYMSGKRLSSDGSVSTGANNYVTGFIPCKRGDVIRFENFGFSVDTVNEITATNKRIAFYDSSKVFVAMVNATQIITQGVLTHETDDNGGLTKLTVANFSDKDLSSVAYCRICCHYIGYDTIITVNEEITHTTEEDGVAYRWKNTGHAFVPSDYEDRILALEYDSEDYGQRIKSLEDAEKTTTESGDVPQAVKDEASALVNKSLSRADGNALRAIIYTDAHQKNDHELITKGNRELGQAIGEVVKQIGIDFVSGAGDNSWSAYSNTTEEVREQTKQLNSFINPYIKGEQILNTEGNHDDAVYSTIDNDGDGTTSSREKLSLSETYSLIYAKNKNVVHDTGHYIDGYCYKDFEYLGVRVIVLNTEQGNGDGGVLEGYQLKWFAEIALNVPDNIKHVITLAHHPFSYGTASLFDAVEIINAFINNENFSYNTNDGTSISIDYSNKDCRHAGHYHGHAHALSVVRMQRKVNGTYVDINAWEICIPNACYSRNNQYVGNANERLARYSTETTYNKLDEDGKRTAFNLITIDLDNKIIYADNYGAGIDRIISYGDKEVTTYTITRNLTNCTSSNSVTSIVEGERHTETLTSDDGYTLDGGTITVTMGGNDVTDSVYADGVITISEVTGDIVITASAVEVVTESSNLLDVSTRTFESYGSTTFVENTETRDIDYTKCYAVDTNGRRGTYPYGKFSDVVLDSNGLTATCNSSSGYGIEFPVDVEGGKTYTLECTDTKNGKVMLIKFNSDGTLNATSNITTAKTFTAEVGFKYSISFHWASETKTISDISLTKN